MEFADALKAGDALQCAAFPFVAVLLPGNARGTSASLIDRIEGIVDPAALVARLNAACARNNAVQVSRAASRCCHGTDTSMTRR